MAVIELKPNPVEGDADVLPSGQAVVFRNGAWRQVRHTTTGPAVNLELDQYNLKHMVTTGAMDLSVCQSYNLDNTIAGVKAITLLNPPVGRAMAVVLKIQGSVGMVTFPAGIDWPDGAYAPVAGKNLVVFYYDGSVFTAIQGPSA